MDRNRIALAVGGVVLLAAAAFVATLLVRDPLPSADEIAERAEEGLARVETVQGQLELSDGSTVLQQELWVERPKRLRTEIESGPPGVGPTADGLKATLVLTEEEAWFYNPNLDLATVTDRSDYSAEMGLTVGSSILETMPQDVLAALRTGQLQVLGAEERAGRNAVAVQIFVSPDSTPFGGSQLTVWLDRTFFYPLAIESDSGFALRFQMVVFNQEIDPATFVFVPPPGATVNRIQHP